MIGLRVRTKSQVGRVKRKAKQGTFNSLGHAGAAVRLAARRSIRRRETQSAIGQPPHTRRGQLRRAIAYAVDKARQRVLIGPDAAVVGSSGAAHEFGGRYRRERYPKRPFMGPALIQVKGRLPKLWANSIRP
jgi:hypothetical protein